MAEINFNVTDNSYPYDCLYYDTNYGYRACLNGKRLDIADIKTVIALKDKFGLPELNISEKDIKLYILNIMVQQQHLQLVYILLMNY